MIYSLPSSFCPSWRDGLGGTGCQGKFSFNKTGQKITLVVMRKLFNDALVKNSINATLYTQAVNSPDVNLLDLSFLEPFKVSMTLLPKMKTLDSSWRQAYRFPK